MRDDIEIKLDIEEVKLLELILEDEYRGDGKIRAIKKKINDAVNAHQKSKYNLKK